MRIAMIGSKGIPATLAHGGGVERHVEELSTRLVEEGHSVTVYVRTRYNTSKRKTWKGCKLVTLPTIYRKNFEAIVHVFLSTIHALSQGYDIIHYHGVGPSTLAWIPRVFAPKARVVVTFHSHDKDHEKWNAFAKAYLAWGEWTAVRFPHATISVSHVIKQFCKQMFEMDVTYIPNGVEIPDTHVAANHVEKMGLRPNGYLLSLGRLVPQKAFDVALEAYRDVDTVIEYAIAGEAAYDQGYTKLLKDLATRDERVHMLGYVSGEVLQQLLAHAYAVVHPSRSEGLSIAILEAMSYGKVVVMSDIPENREVVDHSGVAFPVDDKHSLRSVLSWLVQDPVLVRERGERSRSVVRQLYSWDAIVRKTELLYLSLLK
jgi:glycosyltransferase involved in cell wall biosynthesis